jgi:PAS domain S-box-containing protein
MSKKATARPAQSVHVILDSIADGVFTVGEGWTITAFNRAAEEITGVPRDEAVGQVCCDVFHASICEADCALRQTLLSGRPIVDKRAFIVAADGRRVPISLSTALLRDGKGNVIGGVETFRDLSLVEELRRELDERRCCEDLISRNHAMRRIFDILPDVADSESTVLVEGPSGSGKELLARAIHGASPRADGPLVVVNCGALPETLIESELFGHVAGAFTDARRDRAGRVAQADGGTLFLDEIGDLAPAAQVKLLRVLQERTFEPVGSDNTRSANVRVIAATHRDLDAMVADGSFREDLFYRINVIRLRLPPLAERREDVPLLAEHFVRRLETLRGRRVLGISDEAMAALVEHDWPGNVRELENAIEHAFVLSRGEEIRPEHLPPAVRELIESGIAEPRTLAEMEAAFIRRALARNRGARGVTASELGIDRGTLRRKMAQHGIDAPEDDAPDE